MKYVEIKWSDHASFTTSEWRDDEEYEELEPQKIITVGQLLKETDEYYIIILCHNPQSEIGINKYTGDIMILKSCVTSYKELK